MLSYQHTFHAGNAADVHKHSILCRLLRALRVTKSNIVFVETHGGRGKYHLKSKEALKTRDFISGVGRLQNPKNPFPFAVSKDYIGVIKDLNHGAFEPLYPGSPLLAYRMLGDRHTLHLFEKHPREFTVLIQTFRRYPSVQCHFEDGYAGGLAVSIPKESLPIFFIDPSYEIKDEYNTVADFVKKLNQKRADAVVAIWIPMLPQARHLALMETLKESFPKILFYDFQWKKQPEEKGMYGSVMAILNAPESFMSCI
ncbi:MAG: 23S rRNA (adenine(2030)-N(6))-methyltransferase RlmJ [Alphaproteobacteria bacterium]|nr:23S rRNA (adenine(2030)-N(6))-methyltransferase RlmJ [Alphaproteobacteria bacterium]MBN2780014.1 23S rRNA (adenine(2030)-N(6))-methyltransferase RlmJ [Alphaproteobacteria bacterium]